MTTIERAIAVLLVRREIALAVMSAQAYVNRPEWAHMVWHGFEPFMAGGDLSNWIYEIEQILLPRMLVEAGDWVIVAQTTIPLLRSLKTMKPGPVYGCERCTP